MEITLGLTGNYVLAVVGQNPANASVSYSFEAYQAVTTTNTLTLGTEVTGTIVNPGDQATYTFTGSPGQQVYFDNLGFATYLTANLTGPSGYSVFSTYYDYDGIGDADQGPYTLTQSGTYTLTVQGNYYSSIPNYGLPGATGSYDFRLSDTATAPTIATNTVVSGTLSTGITTDLYQLGGTAGERIYFQGQGDSPSSGSVAYLYDPNNNDVTSFYLENSVEITLGLTGNYVLAVVGQNPANASVSYSFEAFQAVTTTNTLTLGTEVTGTIVNPGDEATYTFTGSPGQRIYFDNLGFATYLTANLAGPSGYSVFSTYYDYDGIGDADQGPFTLSEAGTYTLTVQGNYYSSVGYYGENGATGNYDFLLSDTSTAPTIATNTVVSGTLATGITTDLYQLGGTAGERLFFQGQGDAPSDGAYATLYDPNNQSVTSFYLENSSEITLSLTGNYLLAVAGINPANSSVTYSLEAFQTATSTSPLTLGTEVTGMIANPGDEATYTFTGSAGQRIYFDNLGFATGINASLTGPSGNTIFYPYYYNGIGDADQGPFTLTQPGTYTLTILGYYYGYNGATGSYDFKLSDTSTVPTITTDTVVSGTLATGITTDLYQLSGTAGEQVYFQGQGDAPSDGAYAMLYDPNNQSVTSFYLENSSEITLSLTGNYLLAVAGINPANSSVTYSFEAFQTATSTSPLTLGTEVTGMIANPGDEATYTFTGSVGQRIYFDNLGFATGINASLTGPSGNTIFYPYYYNGIGDADQGPFTLTQPGTYTLTILGYYYGYNGAPAATTSNCRTLRPCRRSRPTPW